MSKTGENDQVVRMINQRIDDIKGRNPDPNFVYNNEVMQKLHQQACSELIDEMTKEGLTSTVEAIRKECFLNIVRENPDMGYPTSKMTDEEFDQWIEDDPIGAMADLHDSHP